MLELDTGGSVLAPPYFLVPLTLGDKSQFIQLVVSRVLLSYFFVSLRRFGYQDMAS